MKITRGICLQHVHTVSATITPNKSQSVYMPRDNIHEIYMREIRQESAKDIWPECLWYFLKNNFIRKMVKQVKEQV